MSILNANNIHHPRAGRNDNTNTLKTPKWSVLKTHSYLGFTLVELIVVITILVILGTIAFVSLSGFSGSARDSSRVSDLSLVSKGLAVTLARNGTYPDPTAWTGITYSGGTVWKQGTMGDGVISQISGFWVRMSKKPVDPLSSAEYTYSITTESKEYSLKADYEGSKVGWNTPSSAYADTGNPTIAYIAGNYNGIATKVTVGAPKTVYLIAIPNIVTPASVTGITIGSNQNFILNGSSNASGVTFSPKVIYQSGALPSNDTEKVLFASGVISAYSGTSLSSTPNVSQFITNASSTGTLATVWGGVVNMVWGGGGVISNVVASVDGPCSGIIPWAVYYNGATTYSLTGATAGTPLVATYNATPTANTCQFKCNTDYTWNGSSACTDSYSKLLLHWDGTNGGIVFTDSSTAANSISRFGSPVTSTGQSKFWGSSISLNQATSDYLQTSHASNFAILWWDYTVDFWIRTTSTAGASIMSIHRSGYGYYTFRLYMAANGTVQPYIYGGGDSGWNGTDTFDTTYSAASINDGTWHHLAVVSKWGGVTNFYIDGNLQKSATTATNAASLDTVIVGGEWYNSIKYPEFTGYIDELRISKGIARWSGWAPSPLPTAPY